jgi:hypothetical protein
MKVLKVGLNILLMLIVGFAVVSLWLGFLRSELLEKVKIVVRKLIQEYLSSVNARVSF